MRKTFDITFCSNKNCNIKTCNVYLDKETEDAMNNCKHPIYISDFEDTEHCEKDEIKNEET